MLLLFSVVVIVGVIMPVGVILVMAVLDLDSGCGLQSFDSCGDLGGYVSVIDAFVAVHLGIDFAISIDQLLQRFAGTLLLFVRQIAFRDHQASGLQDATDVMQGAVSSIGIIGGKRLLNFVGHMIDRLDSLGEGFGSGVVAVAVAVIVAERWRSIGGCRSGGATEVQTNNNAAQQADAKGGQVTHDL